MNKKKGFTIIEIMIAFAIFAVIMTGVAQMQGRLSNTYSKTQWAVLTRNKLRSSFLMLKTYIEKSNYLSGVTSLGSFYLSTNAQIPINKNGNITNSFYSFEGFVPDRFFQYKNSSGTFSTTIINNEPPTTSQINLFEFSVCEPYENINGVVKNPSRTRFSCFLNGRVITLSAIIDTGVATGFYLVPSGSPQSISLIPNVNIFGDSNTFSKVLFDEVSQITLSAKEITPVGETLNKDQRDNASEMKYYLNWQKKGIFTMKIKLDMQKDMGDDLATKTSVTDEFTVEVPVRIIPDTSM